MIVEIECLPTPPGTPDVQFEHVEAAIAVIQNSGLKYEVGALGSTVEGDPDELWPLMRRVHEACLESGAESLVSVNQGRPAGRRRRYAVDGGAHGPVPERRARLVTTALRAARHYLPAALFLAALIAVWDVWVRVAGTPSYLLPPPGSLLDAFLDQRAALPGHIRTTLSEALLGLAFAALLGVGAAALIASLPLARRVLYPLLVVSQNIPVLVLAPLLAVWFGFGLTPKVLIVVLIGFFPIAVNTADGLMNADREMVALVRSMGADRLKVLRLVLIPSAVPSFFAGLQIGAAYAVIAAVIAEWMGASSGLGLFIIRSQRAFRTDQIFMAVVLIALISITLFVCVHLLARYAMPWRHAGAPTEGN